MKLNHLLATFLLLATAGLNQLLAQCSTTDATSCQCADSTLSDCDLLPDITVSAWAMSNYLGGPTEYPQTGAGVNNGRLRISGSTPNIGHGSLTVGSVSMWVCGVDTFTTNPGTCANGSAPQQLIKQKIYHKTSNAMSYYERWAGAMTYHPTHGHMHVDDWEVMTLRIQDPNEPDPRNWPIVGTGQKLGFCLMDYGSCNQYNGHCRDSANNILTSPNFPNYGLGGGQYNCSPVEQGISSGYTDIYSENLDGMWIDIPPGTCNGDYWVVMEADPHNVFLEENENNNWAAVPVTLTQQVPAGQGLANITYSGDTHLCAGETLTLTANAGTAYSWSTGDTTATLNVTQSGTYEVTVTSQCGVATSQPLNITIEDPVAQPTTSATNSTVCYNQSTTLTASGTAAGYRWFDDATAGNLLIDNASFTTPNLTATTTFYAEAYNLIPGPTVNGGPLNNTIGTGGNYTQTTRYLIFDVLQPCELVSVWVLANSAGTRNIQLRDNAGVVLDSAVVQVPQGASRVNVNFSLPVGTNYQLGVKANSLVDLYRNNGGVAYPYPISTANANIINITNSSAGSTVYYFFYDWEVKTQDKLCVATPRTPIQIDVQNAITASETLNICEGDSIMIGSAYYSQPGTYTNTYTTALGCDSTVTTTLNVNALPAPTISGLTATTYPSTVTSVAMTGTPAGGTFSGPGVTGNIFNPQQAGIGGPYMITYTYTNSEGCIGTATQEVSVYDASGIENQLNSMNLNVMPNPNNGTFKVKFELKEAQNVRLALVNLAGQKVWEENLGKVNGSVQKNVRIQQTAAGVYFLEIHTDMGNYRTKVIVE